jgi:hypothetical protein
MPKRFAACAVSTVFLSTIIIAQPPVVRTADPIKRGMQLSDFPRTVKVADNVYTYEDFHAGDEKFTTTNMFVVTSDGVRSRTARAALWTGPRQARSEKVTPKPSRPSRSRPITATSHRGNASSRRRALHHPPDLEGDPRSFR